MGRVNDTPPVTTVSPDESSSTFETFGGSAIWVDGCLIQNEMLCMLAETGQLIWQLHAEFARAMQAHTSVCAGKSSNKGADSKGCCLTHSAQDPCWQEKP